MSSFTGFNHLKVGKHPDARFIISSGDLFCVKCSLGGQEIFNYNAEPELEEALEIRGEEALKAGLPPGENFTDEWVKDTLKAVQAFNGTQPIAPDVKMEASGHMSSVDDNSPWAELIGKFK